jgi:hypothetical protein
LTKSLLYVIINCKLKEGLECYPLAYKKVKKVLDKIKKVCYNIREEKEKNLNVNAFSKENFIKHLTNSTKYAIIIAERKKEGIK